jgi:hypothetical protein
MPPISKRHQHLQNARHAKTSHHVLLPQEERAINEDRENANDDRADMHINPPPPPIANKRAEGQR